MTAPLLDLDGALEFLDGDDELRDQLLRVLRRTLENAVDVLPGLVARQEWAEVCGIAHKLAPSLGIFCRTAAAPVSALGILSTQVDKQGYEALAEKTLPLLARLLDEVRCEVESRDLR